MCCPSKMEEGALGRSGHHGSSTLKQPWHKWLLNFQHKTIAV